jgi:hypothetical protein
LNHRGNVPPAVSTGNHLRALNDISDVSGHGAAFCHRFDVGKPSKHRPGQLNTGIDLIMSR